MLVRCAIVLVAISAAWAPAQTDETEPDTVTEDVDPSSDAEIEEAIRQRFASSAISSDNFEVIVRNGVAILRGRADVVQHKGTATRLAKLAGADSVDNRIEITDRARSRASRSARSQPRRVRVRRPRSE